MVGKPTKKVYDDSFPLPNSNRHPLIYTFTLCVLEPNLLASQVSRHNHNIHVHATPLVMLTQIMIHLRLSAMDGVSRTMVLLWNQFKLYILGTQILYLIPRHHKNQE